MVEKRTSKCSHEEVVGKHIPPCDRPHRQRPSVVMPQDQGAGISKGSETVIAPAIDLHLVLIEPMP